MENNCPGNEKPFSAVGTDRRDPIFRDQSANSCKWNAQNARGCLHVDE
jgi:hypothetical protein